jgi:signal transduction protein with GAF and PtsI domain
MSGDRWSAAAASSLLPDEATCSALLDSTVEATRHAFGAAACSIALLDEGAGELIFVAAAGAGAEAIVGDRFPADAGISGWVVTAQQPLSVDEVEADPRFASDVASRSGYVPRTIMAAPLLRGERALGVLAVLDREPSRLTELAAMDLLSACARQGALAAGITAEVRRARAAAGEQDPDLAAVARLAGVLDGLEGGHRKDAQALLEALERLLRRR